MSHAGWGVEFDRILALFAAEPIEFRIAVGLIAVLAVVMMLEGVRTSLFARRRAIETRPAVMVAAPRPAQSAIRPAKQAAVRPGGAKIRTQIKTRLHQPKPVKVKLKPYRSYRPRINRKAGAGEGMVTEDGAPFSPLARHSD